MFCPKCSAEYRAGFTECADCRVPLVAELAETKRRDRRPDMKFKTVFTTTDPALASVAKSVLEAAGIESFAIDASAFPGGLKSRLQVDADRAAEAEALLEELEE